VGGEERREECKGLEGGDVVVPQNSFIGSHFVNWRLIIASYRRSAEYISYFIRV